MLELKINQNFSNIQLELLKLYSTDVQENELLEIKKYLAKYFAKKAIKKADRVWDEKGFNSNKMDEWLNEK